jgi:PadR family transcriptional regulator PadR
MVDASDRNQLIAQMRRGALGYCVLAQLENGERYGLEIVKALAGEDGMVTSEGTMYPLLSRLRRDRLVATTWQESPSGPPRRYYRLTAVGATALSEFRREWRRFSQAVDRIMAGAANDHC